MHTLCSQWWPPPPPPPSLPRPAPAASRFQSQPHLSFLRILKPLRVPTISSSISSLSQNEEIEFLGSPCGGSSQEGVGEAWTEAGVVVCVWVVRRPIALAESGGGALRLNPPKRVTGRGAGEEAESSRCGINEAHDLAEAQVPRPRIPAASGDALSRGPAGLTPRQHRHRRLTAGGGALTLATHAASDLPAGCS